MTDFNLNSLTINERKAFRTLLTQRLEDMGGSRPADFENDPYTWAEAEDLVIDGAWSEHSAAGTFGALDAKGLVYIDREGSFIPESAWRWADTVWGDL